MCFFSQGTPHPIDITHYPFWHHTYPTLFKTVLQQLYIISLSMHSQPLTSISKSAADILNHYQFFPKIYHAPILYMVTPSPKCRDLDSELLSSNFRIRSHLDQAFKTDIKVPPSNNTVAELTITPSMYFKTSYPTQKLDGGNFFLLELEAVAQQWGLEIWLFH